MTWSFYGNQVLLGNKKVTLPEALRIPEKGERWNTLDTHALGLGIERERKKKKKKKHTQTRKTANEMAETRSHKTPMTYGALALAGYKTICHRLISISKMSQLWGQVFFSLRSEAGFHTNSPMWVRFTASVGKGP